MMARPGSKRIAPWVKALYNSVACLHSLVKAVDFDEFLIVFDDLKTYYR
jgi:hypothetical protein